MNIYLYVYTYMYIWEYAYVYIYIHVYVVCVHFLFSVLFLENPNTVGWTGRTQFQTCWISDFSVILYVLKTCLRSLSVLFQPKIIINQKQTPTTHTCSANYSFFFK